MFGLNGGATYYPLKVIRQFRILQQVPLAWNPEEFTFDIPSGIIPEEEKNVHQAKIHKIILSLDNSLEQIIEWPKSLGEDMNICMASKEYIKWIENKRPIDFEPYVSLSVVLDPVDEYVPEHIVPSMPRVEPYISEEVVIDVEEWESRAKEW